MCNVEFTFVSPHNGEYWFKCKDCGATDWFAYYDVKTVKSDNPIRGCKKDLTKDNSWLKPL